MESNRTDESADERARRADSQAALLRAAEAAIARVMDASPQRRCAKVIKWAAEYLDASASNEARIAVAAQITGFARDASAFIERGDFGGLEDAIVAFAGAVKSAATIAAPAPALMPPLGGETFRHFGWTSEEQHGLQTLLLSPLCGVKKGDRVVSIDAEAATLASGLKFSREQILAANVPASQGPRTNLNLRAQS